MKHLIFIFLVMISVQNMYSSAYVPDSTSHFDTTKELPIYRSDLNGDRKTDTLMYKSNRFGSYIPSSIHWMPFFNNDTVPRITQISLPDWDSLKCSATVTDFDKDSIADIIFFVRGKYSLDSNHTIDTNLTVILYGDEVLDSISVLNLNQKDSINPVLFYQSRISEINQVHSSMSDIKNKLTSSNFKNTYSIVGNTYNVYPPQRKKKTASQDQSANEISDLFSIYPVPTTGVFYISPYYGIEEKDYKIKVLNITGSEVITKNCFIKNNSYNAISIDLSDFVDGVYIVTISDSQSLVWKKKIIKIN